MHHLYTLLVMASIIASAPTYASGSCLSYGHSCWGGITKWSRQGQKQSRNRNDEKTHYMTKSKKHRNSLSQTDNAHGKRSGDLQPAQFIVPKANSMSDRQARLTEYLLSLSQLQQQKNPEDTADDGREEVILMEQPLRLYEILDQLPRSYEGKSSMNN